MMNLAIIVKNRAQDVDTILRACSAFKKCILDALFSYYCYEANQVLIDSHSFYLNNCSTAEYNL